MNNKIIDNINGATVTQYMINRTETDELVWIQKSQDRVCREYITIWNNYECRFAVYTDFMTHKISGYGLIITRENGRWDVVNNRLLTYDFAKNHPLGQKLEKAINDAKTRKINIVQQNNANELGELLKTVIKNRNHRTYRRR